MQKIVVKDGMDNSGIGVIFIFVFLWFFLYILILFFREQKNQATRIRIRELIEKGQKRKKYTRMSINQSISMEANLSRVSEQEQEDLWKKDVKEKARTDIKLLQ